MKGNKVDAPRGPRREALLRRVFDNSPFHLFALTALTVAQPLFDLLGRQPQFLVARHLLPGEILALVAFVFLAVPTVLILTTEVVGRILAGVLKQKKLLDLSYALAISFLATLFALLILRRLPASPEIVNLPLAVILGALVGISYRRFPMLRSFLTLLVPLVLAVPLIFLFLTPVAQRLAPAPEAPIVTAAQPEEVPQKIPVVLVVFDELPTASLLDAEGRIDAQAFPNFASLAKTSTWYQNATSVATTTVVAIPAILTGQYPRAGTLPTLQDHPKNLLSLLSESHHLEVLEPHTELTPRRHLTTAKRSWLPLIQDLGVIYLHLIAPPPFDHRLPPITTWQFNQLPDKARNFRRLVDRLKPQGKKPPLIFLHSALPHHPWIYMPSGKRYSTAGEMIIDGLEHGLGPASARWTADGWPVIQAYQRHLLQLQFTDLLLGELMARLRQLELFDTALIIVTADHGISFVPGGHMRKVDHKNFSDIMSVPLLVKLPGQMQGAVRDDSVEQIDILPTIREVLKFEPDSSLPGISLLGTSPTHRTKLIYHSPQHQLRIPEFDPSGKFHTAHQRRLLFPPSDTTSFFHPALGLRDLLGRPPSAVAPRSDRGLEARIDDIDRFTYVDLRAASLPCRISGRLLEHPERPTAATLAIAINGRIAALTRIRRDPGYAGRFSAIIPEELLRSGRNHLELYLTAEESGVPVLEPVALKPKVTYDLVFGSSGQVEALRSSDGTLHTIIPGYFEGEVVDVVYTERAFRVEFVGWAGDEESGAVPNTIAIFTDDRWIHTGIPNLGDPDVQASYTMPGKEDAGFVFLVPRLETEGEVRFFAIAEDGPATRLHYTRSMKPRASRFAEKG